ncbi:hypothetical protein BGZ98_009313 [Dissophora globulifera]|nr:hypothetical protein BGZ98_009313 [Dissophora globulifera]
MGGNKRKAGKGQDGNGKKAKVDVHKVGKYLPGGFPIDPKMKGVMITCARGKETQAGKEACDLLAEYASKLYGSSFDENGASGDEDESIEDAIAREVAQAKKTKGGKKFLPLLTGTDCVEETGYANMDDIKVMAERVFKPYFHADNQEPKTFKVIPKIRHNDKVDREILLKTLATTAGVGQNHKVNLNDPEYVILAEVIKSICFMSVVKDYESLKKYNIQSIFEACQRTTDGSKEEGETSEQKEDVKEPESSSTATA